MSNFNVHNPPGGPYDPSTLYGWLVQGMQSQWRRISGISGGGGSGSNTNIYNTDGFLTGNRLVLGANNSLTFIGLTAFTAAALLSTFGTTSAILTLNNTDGLITLAGTDSQLKIDTTSKFLEYTISGNQYLAVEANECAIGDIGSAGNGTYVKTDDVVKTVITKNAIASPSMQVYSSTGNVTMDDGTRGIYYDPALVQLSAVITLPAGAQDGQEILILFGGTITGAANPVVTNLTIAPNTAQSINAALPAAANVGTVIALKYRKTGKIWYKIVQ